MPVTNQNYFFSYTLPSEATSYDVGQGASHGNLETNRNNTAVDWTTRKWYSTGYIYNATFDDPPVDNWGLWVGDLDDLTQLSFLPFDRTLIDPFTPGIAYRVVLGLVAFENTNYLALVVHTPIALSSASGTIQHLLINRTTGKILSSVSSSNVDTGQNNEQASFLLPTSDSNVFHRYDFSTHHISGANKWAVIKYNLSTETVSLAADYTAVPALLNDAHRAFISNGQVGDTYNTVYMIDPDSGQGKIFEIEIPHNTTSASDLSATLLTTVAAVSGVSKALRSPYYDISTDRLVYAYHTYPGAFQTVITYEAVARTAPSTVLWTTSVSPDEGPYDLHAASSLQYSGYQRFNVPTCTCIDPDLGQAINIVDGTVTQIAHISDVTRATMYEIVDMFENKVYLFDKVREDLFDFWFADTAQFPGAGHDHPHVDTGNFIHMLLFFRAPLDLVYDTSVCLLTGISFGEEKDPNYIDFAAIA